MPERFFLNKEILLQPFTYSMHCLRGAKCRSKGTNIKKSTENGLFLQFFFGGGEEMLPHAPCPPPRSGLIIICCHALKICQVGLILSCTENDGRTFDIFFLKTSYASYSKLSKELKNSINIKVGQAVLELLIHTTSV